MYGFEIISKSWSKRRKPMAEPKPISVSIPDFKLIDQHFCTMHVVYDNGAERQFYARVIQNVTTKQWTVDGMHVACRVLKNSD